MKTLISVLVVAVVVLGAAAELGAPRLVADRVERRANTNLGGAATIGADAGSFPFIPRLLADNRVRRVTMTLEELAGQELTFGSVEVELRGIVLDRQRLFNGEVEVTDIESGIATVTLGNEALGTLGELLPGDVDLSELSAGQSLNLGLPDQLVPCTPRTQSTDGRLRLRCEFQQVPQVLVRGAG